MKVNHKIIKFKDFLNKKTEKINCVNYTDK